MKTNQAEDRKLTKKQVADMLRVHPATINRWDKSGKLPCSGRHGVLINGYQERYWLLSDVINFLKNNGKHNQ
jgi:DNA-binding transcriptional MerR regulator